MSTPISGTVDRVEYPADPRSRRPETGSVIVAKADASFCRELILPAPPNANFKFYIGVPDRLGSNIGANDWSAPISLPQHNGWTVTTALFDFWDTGQKVPVYLFNSGSTFTTEFALVPDPDATKDEVLQIATSASDWEAAEQAARTKGWSVYTAAGTPFDQDEGIGITFARIDNSTYQTSPRSASDTQIPSPIMMWSRSRMSTSASASLTRCVMSSSAWLGSAMPDG